VFLAEAGPLVGQSIHVFMENSKSAWEYAVDAAQVVVAIGAVVAIAFGIYSLREPLRLRRAGLRERPQERLERRVSALREAALLIHEIEQRARMPDLEAVRTTRRELSVLVVANSLNPELPRTLAALDYEHDPSGEQAVNLQCGQIAERAAQAVPEIDELLEREANRLLIMERLRPEHGFKRF
jgi:hypothetical protein